LQRSLGNQAATLRDQGDLDGAMELHREQGRICRELSLAESLTISLGNQALILADEMSRPEEALSRAEEAHRLAAEHGYTALAEWTASTLDRIRKMQK
jgi:hypothetical protein